MRMSTIYLVGWTDVSPPAGMGGVELESAEVMLVDGKGVSTLLVGSSSMLVVFALNVSLRPTRFSPLHRETLDVSVQVQ